MDRPPSDGDGESGRPPVADLEGAEGLSDRLTGGSAFTEPVWCRVGLGGGGTGAGSVTDLVVGGAGDSGEDETVGDATASTGTTGSCSGRGDDEDAPGETARSGVTSPPGVPRPCPSDGGGVPVVGEPGCGGSPATAPRAGPSRTIPALAKTTATAITVAAAATAPATAR